jgi:hypothetical protein
MPLAPGLGYKSSITLAREVTYNTYVSAAEAKMELLGFSVNANLSTIDDPSMTATQLSRRFIGQGGQFVTGTFRVRVNYEGHDILWNLLFGTAARVQVGAETAYDSTHKESSTATLKSWSMGVSWGDVPTSLVNRFTGCFMTGFRLSGAAGGGEAGMLILEVDFVAAAMVESSAAQSGGTFPSPYGIIYHQLLRTAGNFKDGSGAASESDIMLKSFNLAVTVPHDSERFYFGSVNAEAPIRNGPLDCTLEFEEEWNSVLLMQKARLNTMTGLKLLWQHPTLIGTTAKREFELQANTPTAASYSSEIAGFGAITHRVGYRLAVNTTDATYLILRTRNNVTWTP